MTRILLIALLFASIIAHADDLTDIKTTLQKNYPQLGAISAVNKTPIPGLFEIVTAEHLFYTDAKAQYLIDGNIYQLSDMKNLTDERERKLFAVDFSKLPFDLALKQVKGDGRRKLFVFTDPNCGYCKKLEGELQKMDNLTIYRLLFPIFPGSDVKARNIWCSKQDRVKLWENMMVRGKTPPDVECNAPLAQAQEWGRKMRVTGTPTLVFADGSVVPGYVPAAELNQALNDAMQQAGKK
jgi:thiol:disulfide interchange protein DsbC